MVPLICGKRVAEKSRSIVHITMPKSKVVNMWDLIYLNAAIYDYVLSIIP